MRWRPALVLLALVAGAPSAAAACAVEEPCVLRVEVTDLAVAVSPAVVEEAGAYVLDVANHGFADATVSIADSPVSVAVPANGTARSQPFGLAAEGAYTVTAGPGRNGTVRDATFEVALPPAPPLDPPPQVPGSRSAELLALALPVLVGLALMGIAVLVVRHGQGHRHNLFFAGLYFLSGLKSLGEGLQVRADSFHAGAALFPPALFWELLGLFCALAMMPLLFLFVASFPRPVRWMTRSPGLGLLAVLPSAFVAAALLLAVAGAVDGRLYLGAVSAFNVLFFAVTLAAVVLLARTRARSPDAIERTQSLYVLLGFLPAFVAGWAISGLQFAGETGLAGRQATDALVAGIVHFVSPVLELVACGLVAVAILKYNILGIDPKFRLGVKSAVAGLLFIAIFLATQFVENVVLQGQVFAFAGDYGSFLLSGVAGVLLFKPIEAVSAKVSNRLLPQAEAASGSLHAEQIYHAQASYVLRDARVTDRELAFLRNLRAQLGLSDARARRIEEEVERLLKVDDPRTGALGA